MLPGDQLVMLRDIATWMPALGEGAKRPSPEGEPARSLLGRSVQACVGMCRRLMSVNVGQCRDCHVLKPPAGPRTPARSEPIGADRCLPFGGELATFMRIAWHCL